MRANCLLLVLLWTMGTIHAHETMIKTLVREGRLYVAATDLSKDADIAIKNLPGLRQIVACSHDRCAIVPDCLRDGAEILVPVPALAQALGATPRFDEFRRRVRFELSSQGESAATGIARVGQLAPNFRLKKLEGGTVALSDLRGKRVLINSWASW